MTCYCIEVHLCDQQLQLPSCHVLAFIPLPWPLWPTGCQGSYSLNCIELLIGSADPLLVGVIACP